MIQNNGRNTDPMRMSVDMVAKDEVRVDLPLATWHGWQFFLILVVFVCGCTPSSHPIQTAEQQDIHGQVVKTESFFIDISGDKVYQGTQIEWFNFERKQKRLETHYVKGKLDGRLTEWYPNGKKAREGNWEQGVQTGCWTEWQPAGEKASECTYRAGKIVGSKLYWIGSGRPIREDRYDDQGNLHEVTTWFQDGQKMMHGTFSTPKKGELAHIRFLADVMEQYPKNGTWTYWDSTGKVLAEGSWKEGHPWEGLCTVDPDPDKPQTSAESVTKKFARFIDGRLIEYVSPDPVQTSPVQ
jgi:antitoxin component YwqK of YwqJK toxin-antitoxin module